MSKRELRFGEAIPHLYLNSNRNPRFATSMLGGRFVLLCVVSDLRRPDVLSALNVLATAHSEDSVRAIALLCADPAGAEHDALRSIAKSKLVFYDDDQAAIEAWGLKTPAEPHAEKWVLFDPTLRALGFWPIAAGASALAALAAMPEPDAHAGVPLNAPVLIAPRIFEPGFCKALIAAYERAGGEPSGTTSENMDGKTYVALNDQAKRRSDYAIAEPHLRDGAMHRIFWRLIPEIEKAFMCRMTRMERYIVACYDSSSGGFFRPHRDNTTKGTAHRRFAVTINLNAEEHDGGDLRFPEFGSRTYRAPTGGAVVFSCSLLHEAMAVTRGKRYAFLPFLYDEAGAKLRMENNAHLDASVGAYRGT